MKKILFVSIMLISWVVKSQPTVVSNTNFNSLSYSPGLCMEYLNNGDLIVGSGNGKILLFDSVGNYKSVFYSYNPSTDHRYASIHRGNNNEIVANYIQSGYTSRAIILNQNGLELKNADVTFGQTSVEDIIQDSTNNYIVSGMKNCGGLGGGWDGRLSYYNSNFSNLWNTSHCLICGCQGSFCNFGDEVPYQVVKENNSIYFSGYKRVGGTGCYNPSDGWIVKTDLSGNQLWNKVLGSSEEDIFFNIKLLPNGNTVSCGYTTQSGVKKVYIVTLDSNGNTIWSKILNSAYDEIGHDIIFTKDGNLLVAGLRTNTINNPELIGIKLDLNGNIIWNQTLVASTSSNQISTTWDWPGQSLIEPSFGRFALCYSTGLFYGSGMGCGIVRFNDVNCLTSNTITADGPTTFCAGNSVNLKSDVVGGTYQWKRNGVNISSNATSRTFKASSTGSYSCVATCNGTALTSNAIAVTSKTNAFASVTASGATSFCAGDSVTLNATNLGSNYSVQWYRTNISMENATAYSQVVKQPGTYKVVTKNLTNGCSRISGSSAVVAVNCRIAGDISSGTSTPLTESEAKFTANELSQGVNIFPNPNSGSFTFAYDGEEYGDAVLQVINSMGQMIYNTNVNVTEGGYTHDVQLGDNSIKGIYIVRLMINGNSYDSRVLVR
jgi:hypothetical protein